MTTRLITASVILVGAIIFAFIFWNQFTSNQQQLAGGDMNQTGVQQFDTTIPKHDNIDSVEADLNATDVNGIDKDSVELGSQFSGF